jgi:hypothetical protein
MPESIPELQDAIRKLHGCGSKWIESVPVHEAFEGRTVWQGQVQVFDLLGHSESTRAYAWSHAGAREGSRRIVAVLHNGPVDSAQAAVRASIVADAKKRGP